jgi:hypothetical protein
VSHDLGDGTSLVGRVVPSYLSYGFSAEAEHTRVYSPGLAVSAGIRWSRPGLSVAVVPGFEARWTRRQLQDGSAAIQTESGPVVQGELLSRPMQRTGASVIASYGHASRYVWSRAGMSRQITDPGLGAPTALGAGIELTVQGNPDVRVDGAGGVVELSLLPWKSSVQLRAGVNRARSASVVEPPRMYLGAGMYKKLAR